VPAAHVSKKITIDAEARMEMTPLDMQVLPDVVAEARASGYPEAFCLESLKNSHLDSEPLSAEWQRRAQEELQEKEEWRERDIQALREMVEAEEGLMCSTSDQFLIRFLRAKKFDYEKAFKMVQRYCAMRSRDPENFEKTLPSLAKDTLECCLQTVLPHRDQLARRVFMFRAGKWNPTCTTPQDIFSTNLMCLELIAREQKSQISGIVAIVDMEGFGWEHIMQLSVEYVRNVVSLVQNSFPIRFREIHIINESYMFDIIYALVKPFLSDKIKNRIRFHGTAGFSSLHRFVSPMILPRDYGGEREMFNNTQLREALDSAEDHFQELRTYGYTDNQVPTAVYDKETTHPFPAFCLSGTLPE